MTCPPFLVNPDCSFEQSLLKDGYKLIAGVDEAGRGSLAGPLTLGLVIFPASIIRNPAADLTKHIRDSKQLSPPQRQVALQIIEKTSLSAEVFMVSHKIIDKKNINGATEFALQRMFEGISIKPDIVIMDGTFSFSLPVPFISIKKGDRTSLTIAAASIMAKVKRDAVMERLDLVYPGYGLSKHKGYGTVAHREAIMHLGYSAIHRKSYEPVKSMAGGIVVQDEN